jgi:hypothetical protein
LQRAKPLFRDSATLQNSTIVEYASFQQAWFDPLALAR